ncbi:MAG: hypothetical protein ACI93R_003618 [Flavobacteriales bacterium]|jgi:hypothetical protein
MSLEKEISDARHNVHTDSYPMSIGELINLYKDGEIEIHPEFQRFYRWTETQKSKLIESILLSIPLPSIFVAQREDGVWDVVDGLQRLSTIFSFMGVLKDEKGEETSPLVLLGTKYLPSLEGKVWEDKHNKDREIDIDIRRVFKREKIDLKIIKRESGRDTKLELFQRLNTGGSKLSDQEVRNCIILMIDTKSYRWLDDLSKNHDFLATTPISDKQSVECYAQELVLRFIVQRNFDEELRKVNKDVGPYLDAETARLLDPQDSPIDFSQEKEIFEKTFSILNKSLGEDAFKKYNHDKNKRQGAVSIPVFEALSTGVSKYIEENPSFDSDYLIKKCEEASLELTRHVNFTDILSNATRPIDRFKIMRDLGVGLIK